MRFKAFFATGIHHGFRVEGGLGQSCHLVGEDAINRIFDHIDRGIQGHSSSPTRISE